MNNTQEVVNAVLEYTREDYNWGAANDKELMLWFEFGKMICELKNKKIDLSEKIEASSLRDKFLNKIKND